MKLNFNRVFPEKKSLTLERLGFPEKTKLLICKCMIHDVS